MATHDDMWDAASESGGPADADAGGGPPGVDPKVVEGLKARRGGCGPPSAPRPLGVGVVAWVRGGVCACGVVRVFEGW